MMSDVTRILQNVQQGDAHAAEELFQMIYDELRRLAASKMARERPGQTIQATELVHDAWLRLFGADATAPFENRRHFFGAAAEAMRRILVDRARRRGTREEGGFAHREELQDDIITVNAPDDELLAVHEWLDQLAAEDALSAHVVELRYFVGMTLPQVAESLDIPLRTTESTWAYARSWLRQHIQK